MKPVSLAVVAACGVLLQGVRAEADETDQQKLQGKWTVESFEFNAMPVESMQGAIREFKDDQYTLTPISGETYSGTIKLDATKTPHQIDLVMPDRTLKGIYEIDGDALKIAYALEGDARPTEFASKPDSGAALVIHKRAK